MLNKPYKVRNKKHLEFIRRLPCVKTGKGPCEACHIRLGGKAGIGQKPGDDLTLPMTHETHMDQHKGERTFYQGNDDKARELAGLLYHYTGDEQTCIGLIIHYRKEIFG